LAIFVVIAFFLIEALIPYESRDLPPGGSVLERFGDYVSTLARGSLGLSYSGAPVVDVLAGALPTTMLVFATGGILAYLLGSWLGRIAEWRMGRMGTGLLTTVGLGFYTLFPPLLVFLLVHFGRDLLLLARKAIGLPADSMQVFIDAPFDERQLVSFGGMALLSALVLAVLFRSYGRRRSWRLLPALALPAALTGLILGIARMGIGRQALDVFFFRSTREVEIGAGSPVLAVLAFFLLAFGEVMFVWRAGIADERGEDYVLTARAKALPEREVRDRHVARNVLLPVLSRSFAALPFLLTGLILIEYQVQVGSCALTDDLGQCVYWEGGLSTALFTAVRNVDVPVVLGVMVTMGVVLLALRLVAETAHVALDPRLRIGAQG
jgi:ABC-type dipeptide/oligopeptide/nickel transport system permease component